MLFLGTKETDDDVVDALEERIELLKKVNSSQFGYKYVIQQSTSDGTEVKAGAVFYSTSPKSRR